MLFPPYCQDFGVWQLLLLFAPPNLDWWLFLKVRLQSPNHNLLGIPICLPWGFEVPHRDRPAHKSWTHRREAINASRLQALPKTEKIHLESSNSLKTRTALLNPYNLSTEAPPVLFIGTTRVGLQTANGGGRWQKRYRWYYYWYRTIFSWNL